MSNPNLVLASLNSVLYLDDLRHPQGQNIQWVRTLTGFKRYLDLNPMPDLISFDYYLSGNETGLDAARWLIDQNLPLRLWSVHSGSPSGAKAITDLLEARAPVSARHLPSRIYQIPFFIDASTFQEMHV